MGFPKCTGYSICQFLIAEPAKPCVIRKSLISFYSSDLLFKIFKKSLHVVYMVDIKLLTRIVIYKHANHTRLTAAILKVFKEINWATVVRAVLGSMINKLLGKVVLLDLLFCNFLKHRGEKAQCVW